MKTIVWLAVLLFAGYIYLRIRGTYRKTKRFDKGDQIRRELEALRKKRDEE